ncbi:hypothetical protein IWQ60_007938 [Tieghemiomyces parasiticus]|uniref:SCP domain-containing protein n=1 Tax=Tieghemiomyces parasiticus TaxID=78921 RepID=A0A9W8DTA1_9FUNG|nr:hypothetical protein IWQ60_007938 [Tieghemiomyces parasiticus]
MLRSGLLTLAVSALVLAIRTTHAAPLDSYRMLSLVNDARQSAGEQPVELTLVLNEDAYHHSNYQASLGAVTHNDSHGSGSERLSEEGVHLGYWSENVAFTHGDEDEAFRTWMNSPGHRKNILSPAATHMGISEVKGYWTQVFAQL